MRFIGFFDDFLQDSRQPDKIRLFISAMLLSGQLLKSKPLKPKLYFDLPRPSLARYQPKFPEKPKGTGQLQVDTRAISYQ